MPYWRKYIWCRPSWHSNTWNVILIGWLEWNMPDLGFCCAKEVYIKNCKTYICLDRKLFVYSTHEAHLFLRHVMAWVTIYDISYRDERHGRHLQCKNLWECDISLNNMYHRSVPQKLKLKIFRTIVFMPLFQIYMRCTFVLISL